MNIVDLSKLNKVNIKGITQPLKFLDTPIRADKIGIYMSDEDIQKCITAGVIVEQYKEDGSVEVLTATKPKKILDAPIRKPKHTVDPEVKVEDPVEVKEEKADETPVIEEVTEEVKEEKTEEPTQEKIKFNKKRNRH